MPNEIAFLIASIVKNEGKGHLRVECAQFIEQLTNRVGIDVGVVGDHDELMGDGIQSAQDIKALPSGWCLNEDAAE